MKIALVALQDAADIEARLSRARARGEVELIAPPALAGHGRGRWPAREGLGDRRAPGVRDMPANEVFEALRASGTVWDEIRFDAKSGAGVVVCAEAKSGGIRLAKRLVIEVEAGDEQLSAPRALGESIDDRVALSAVRMALRDCDAVEGDSAAIAGLRAAGWELAREVPAPGWGADEARGVTAVVTYYNLGRWLPACIASLRAQTVPVEIVIVDDGSTPEQAAVADAEVAKDPAIRLVRQANAGLPAARNRGAQEASHDLVLMVDADNTMRPRLVERLREALRVRPDAGWACPAFHSYDDATGATAFNYGPAELCNEVVLLRNVIGDGCALYRRSALQAAGGFGLDYTPHPDWHFWLRAFEAGLSGAAVPEILFDYRERGDSMLRGMTPLAMAFSRTELVRMHPRLLARDAETISRLEAAEIVAEHAHRRWLGSSDRDGEVAALVRELSALRAYTTKVEQDLQASQQRTAAVEQSLSKVESQLPQFRDYVAKLERDLMSLRGYSESLEREVAQRDVQLQAARADSEVAQLKALAAMQRAHAAELARNESEIANSERAAAFEEMSRSSAVRASRLLAAANPAAHRAVGALVTRLLRWSGR